MSCAFGGGVRSIRRREFRGGPSPHRPSSCGTRYDDASSETCASASASSVGGQRFWLAFVKVYFGRQVNRAGVRDRVPWRLHRGVALEIVQTENGAVLEHGRRLTHDLGLKQRLVMRDFREAWTHVAALSLAHASPVASTASNPELSHKTSYGIS